MTNTLSTSDQDLGTAGDGGLVAENDDAAVELAEFQTKVRDAVLGQHRAGHWCLPGSNDVLRDLDLPLIEYSYDGQVSVTVDVVVPSAPDRFAAANLLRDHLTVQSGDATVEIRDFTVQPYPEDQLTERSPR